MDINSWKMSLDEHIDDGWDGVKKIDLIFSSIEDQAIADAMKMNDSTVAARVWLAIADGSIETDIALLWVHHIAKQIKASVIDNKDVGVNRANEALKAIGFAGQVDKHHAAKEFMRNNVVLFEAIDENGRSIPSKPLTTSEWFNILKLHNLLPSDDRKTSMTRINEWRRELNI